MPNPILSGWTRDTGAPAPFDQPVDEAWLYNRAPSPVKFTEPPLRKRIRTRLRVLKSLAFPKVKSLVRSVRQFCHDTSPVTNRNWMGAPVPPPQTTTVFTRGAPSRAGEFEFQDYA